MAPATVPKIRVRGDFAASAIEKPRLVLLAANRGFRYFKRPADCDDEESLEEQRGRAVLRTVMLSTRADRNYGPPDGSQPEFDL